DGQPQHRPVRRAAADGRLRNPDRHACRDDARLRRGRLPRGRLGHLRRARRRRRHRSAGGAEREALRAAAAVSRLPRLHDLRRVSIETSTGVTVVTHPLVQHKLSYLRDKDTPTVHFRKLAGELTLLLTYEATKDFPTEPDEIETPLERMEVRRIAGKKVAV